jgi:hypothetical protein
MALHLNLNHELEKARAQRRRDPFKLSMIALLFVAALFVVQYFWTMTQTAIDTYQRDAKKKEFAKIEPLATAAAAEEAELRRKLGNSERFQKRIESRFYWAPLIQLVMETVPGNIHITRFAGDVNAEDPTKVQFKLEGIVAGSEPRTIAEDFRQKLGQTVEKRYRNVNTTFRHLDESSDTVQIEGKPAPTASFAINVQLQHGEPPAATPAPAPREPKKH